MIERRLIVTVNEYTNKMRGMISGNAYSPASLDGLSRILYKLPWYKSLLISLFFFADIQYSFQLFIKKDELPSFLQELAKIGKIHTLTRFYDKNYVYVYGYFPPKMMVAIRLAT